MKEAAWILGGLLVLLALLYVGGYYVTVEKELGFGGLSWPRYRLGGDTLFTPMHFVDRRLRSDYWGPPRIWEVVR